ncbi:carbohydrate-binding protein [Ruania albidiflava]|uniref:carbohydrate-binding protein n=1 Tax=Ruania albidiflava TaxID=366586 RepID=UPI0023F00295|nr:carbohydrate-binding protein [Ruania albidiflava]
MSTRTIRGTARGVIAGTLGAALATTGLAVAAGPAAAAPEEDTSTATGAAPADASDFEETVLLEEDFSSGALPEDWLPVVGDWEVVDGRLQSTSGDEAARIGFGPQAPENFRVEVSAEFVEVENPARWLSVGLDYHAEEHWGAWVGLRSQTSADNGVEFVQRPQSGSNALSAYPGPFDMGTGQAHDLVFEVHGSSLVASIDGEEMFQTDELRRTDGSFGFRYSRSTVAFDDVRITEIAPQASAPGAPQNVHLTEDGDTATITWDAPADPGVDDQGQPATITGYEVASAPAGTPGDELVWGPAAAESSHTFTDLPGDAEQMLQVRATNSIGLTGEQAAVVTMRGAETVGGYKLQLQSGPWPTSHVQGIAVDEENGFVYYSFTTLLVKTDLAGNIIGTVGGFTGHLGDLDFNAEDGRLYGSLEYKDAEAFYIAIFDVDEIDEVGMDAQNSPIVSTVYLEEVVEDYTADMDGDGVFDGDTGDTADHRYGSSGIDGVGFGPAFGEVDGPQLLTVAYGIYSNTERTDNDHQVLLQYDISDWTGLERPLAESDPHHSGPDAVDGKYFVFTGNTTYGVQNLEFDPWLDRWFMGVYVGKKDQYPNYELFAVDAESTPSLETLTGLDGEQGLLLPLAEDGLLDEATGIRGWYETASVGIQSLGDGLYYLSTQTNDGGQGSILTLETWTGHADDPFVPVTADFDPVSRWDGAATYTAGDTVAHARSIWQASWWTRGQEPGDPYGPWQEIVTTSDGTAVWTPSRIFDAGDVVSHDGTRYEAQWWTRNQEPGAAHGPWRAID